MKLGKSLLGFTGTRTMRIPLCFASVFAIGGPSSQREFRRRLGIQGHINALLCNTKFYPTNSIESVVGLAIEQKMKLNVSWLAVQLVKNTLSATTFHSKIKFRLLAPR